MKRVITFEPIHWISVHWWLKALSCCQAGRFDRLEAYVIHSMREMQDVPASQQHCVDPITHRNVAVDHGYLNVLKT